ncbi:hypothetical protein V2S84_04325, partial [Azotobacter chroococcum]|nr:hypothetical protein [Azotobacter chroococcum]
MDRSLAKRLILEVGHQYGYETSGTESDSVIYVYFDRSKHGIAFQIRNSTHARATEEGWLQIHHFEGEPEEWGPALHSLRTIGDVVAFCQTLITFDQIK